MEVKHKKFVALYGSNFGAWPAKGDPYQQDLWYQFLLKIPEGQIKRLVENVVADRGDDRRKPLLPQFRNAWQRMKGNTTAKKAFNAQPCGVCHDSGTVIAYGWFGHDEAGNKVWMFTEEEGRPLGRAVFPCQCRVGQAVRQQSRFRGYPDALCRDAYEVARDAFKARLREFEKKTSVQPPNSAQNNEMVSKHHPEEKTQQTAPVFEEPAEYQDDDDTPDGIMEKCGYKKDEVPF